MNLNRFQQKSNKEQDSDEKFPWGFNQKKVKILEKEIKKHQKEQDKNESFENKKKLFDQYKIKILME